MTLPKEFCERMKELLGNEYDAFIDSYNTKLNRGIRINTLKCPDAAKLAREIGADMPVAWCGDGYYIDKDKINGSHPYHAAGLFYFQEPSAMSAAEGLPMCANPHILDLCAAPGGKTTHIAAKMQNSGLLISNEIVPKRAAILAENTDRMGLTNTVVTNEAPSRLAEKFPCFFDGIIVDAPCSGEGMFRKEPQAVEAWSVEHTKSCAIRQKNILDDAYKMLKPGGYIMYSTCTFSYDENEAIAQYMVEEHKMEICDVPALTALSDGCGNFPSIEKCRRVFPHKHDGEGHFAVLLKRTEPADTVIKPPKKKNKRKAKPDTLLNDAVKLFRDFKKAALNIQCEGEFVLFGDNLYLLPENLDISGLKILRCGLHLGTIKRGRFEPSHALSHAFPASVYKNTLPLDNDPQLLQRFMHGEVINGSMKGWGVITVKNCGIGWGKGSGVPASSGIIKNHYPKSLRLLNIV